MAVVIGGMTAPWPRRKAPRNCWAGTPRVERERERERERYIYMYVYIYIYIYIYMFGEDQA